MMERKSDSCTVKKMPAGYELDDYWMDNVVLKDPKQAEDEFYSAYGYFHSSSLYPLPDYVAKKIAAAPPYDWYAHHSKNHLHSCPTRVPSDHNNTTKDDKKKKKKSRDHKRPLLKVNDGGLIKKKPPHLILGFKKQNNSHSWSVTVTVQENIVADNPLQKEEDETQKHIHVINHSLNSVVACNIVPALAGNPVPPVLSNDQEEVTKKLIMGEMGGCDELVLVIKKKLTLTDVSQQHNRLSIPKSQVKNDFLNSQEEALLVHPQRNLRNINVKLLVQNQQNLQECKVHDINLTYWKMNESYIYALNKVWFELVQQHNLEQGMDVQLWAFRIQSQLCFALVRN